LLYIGERGLTVVSVVVFFAVVVLVVVAVFPVVFVIFGVLILVSESMMRECKEIV